MSVTIEVANEATDELVRAFAELIPQLSQSSPPPDAAQVAALVDDPGSVVFLARLNGEIVGTLTLVLYRIPTGLKAWIEDVVVDASARGHGVGDLLNQAALEAARHRGVKAVSLTSRPSREAANRLYQRIGFTLRETNVYRYDV
ncbi:MAG TPA: GNAT family N-acetyltransferase [Ilumatobacteraceae bacterium]|nr:GNAT family N-acetyltransferase [Ilumatobacteraceae bacterium]HRB03751.1 GNAT family N-acetyltransferase [Ilumatobacteraceae bacterium]